MPARLGLRPVQSATQETEVVSSEPQNEKANAIRTYVNPPARIANVASVRGFSGVFFIGASSFHTAGNVPCRPNRCRAEDSECDRAPDQISASRTPQRRRSRTPLQRSRTCPPPF